MIMKTKNDSSELKSYFLMPVYLNMCTNHDIVCKTCAIMKVKWVWVYVCVCGWVCARCMLCYLTLGLCSLLSNNHKNAIHVGNYSSKLPFLKPCFITFQLTCKIYPETELRVFFSFSDAFWPMWKGKGLPYRVHALYDVTCQFSCWDENNKCYLKHLSVCCDCV